MLHASPARPIWRISASVVSAVVAVSMGGCSALDRLSSIGAQPPLSAINNPTAQPGYKPVTMPMPEPERVVYQPNSLWRSGARAFFKDQRASRVGDILTVTVNINERAKVDNKTTRNRSSAENAGLAALLGYEQSLNTFLPEAVSPDPLVELDSDGTYEGEGTVDRRDEIALDLAAVVTQVLPNGNFVIEGRQEVRVNFEVRELIVAGIVRPEDITATNTVKHTQIAEARISYGGRGQITDVQQPRYGQQVYDVLFPF